ncbi:MAG TPA: DUF2304 family protein [Candidatus Baltobacteraceae bacterium]|nr:DUF2304 family protein [Candidatus Baltobacteraceae bacterium]
MTVIQILLTLFAAFGVGAAVARDRRGGIGLKQLTLWTLLWAAVVAVVIRPETASEVARKLGVGRGADVVIYLSIAALFYLQFRLFARIEDQERQITKLARELALKDLKE